MELLDRIAKATGEIGVLTSDKRNTYGGYDYLSEGKVKAAVQPLIAKHCIAPQSIRYEILSDVMVVMQKGGEANQIKVRCILSWEDGKSEVEGLGCGLDYGDKALMKAQTSAIREAWKARLTLPSGADPEEDNDAADKDAPATGNRSAKPAGEVCLPRMKWLGDDAGKPLSQVKADVLERFGKWKSEKLDPESKYYDNDQRLLNALRDELRRRKQRADVDVAQSLRDAIGDVAPPADDMSDGDPWGLVPPPEEP